MLSSISNMDNNKTQKTQQLRYPNEQLWRQVKAAAVLEGKAMTEWVEEALRKHLAATNKSKGGKEVK